MSPIRKCRGGLLPQIERRFCLSIDGSYCKKENSPAAAAVDVGNNDHYFVRLDSVHLADCTIDSDIYPVRQSMHFYHYHRQQLHHHHPQQKQHMDVDKPLAARQEQEGSLPFEQIDSCSEGAFYIYEQQLHYLQHHAVNPVLELCFRYLVGKRNNLQVMLLLLQELVLHTLYFAALVCFVRSRRYHSNVKER